MCVCTSLHVTHAIATLSMRCIFEKEGIKPYRLYLSKLEGGQYNNRIKNLSPEISEDFLDPVHTLYD
jgi:hypothetical protein